MPRRDPQATLRQMLEHAREVVAMTEGQTGALLASNRVLSLALVRLMEILGEAANRVPPEERAKHPHLPWSQLIGLRNRLIHAYDEVDMDILWQIISGDLPELIGELEAIVGLG